jgi:hypothetical protein
MDHASDETREAESGAARDDWKLIAMFFSHRTTGTQMELDFWIEAGISPDCRMRLIKGVEAGVAGAMPMMKLMLTKG